MSKQKLLRTVLLMVVTYSKNMIDREALAKEWKNY